jgi:septum formation protein
MSFPQPLVLASRSPRRRQLLEMLGIPIRVDVADIQELMLPGEAPSAYARRLARDKARAVPGAFVLGADTIVVLDGEVLEKPRDAEDAVRMLGRLQGKRHDVLTAVALMAEGVLHEADVTTGVWFREADEETLRAYVATGEPMDKAGAYGIQGVGAALVERIEGDYFTVMGLPIGAVLDLMARAGHPFRFGPGPTDSH